jgi:hypothetical protein
MGRFRAKITIDTHPNKGRMWSKVVESGLDVTDAWGRVAV